MLKASHLAFRKEPMGCVGAQVTIQILVFVLAAPPISITFAAVAAVAAVMEG